MFTRISYLPVCSALLAVLMAQPAAAQQNNATISLLTEQYPPFNMYDAGQQNIIGASTDKVRMLMLRAHQPYTLQLLPWSRALSTARQQANACLFSTTRTAERDHWFKWVGPLVVNNWTVFGRASDARRPGSLDEIRTATIGSYRNSAMAEYLQAHGIQTELSSGDSENPKKLLYRRFDYWATGEAPGLALLREQHLSEQIVPLFQFEKVEMYLACNLAMDNKRIEQFRKILREMDKDGSSALIERVY